jgi:hypothetical protein
MGKRRIVMATAGGPISRRAEVVPNIGTLDGTPVVMKTGSSVSEPALVCGVEMRPVAVEMESVAVAMEPVAMHAAGVSRSPMVSGGMMEPVVVNEVIAGVSQTPSERVLRRRAVLASIQSNLQALILQINATTIQMSTWFQPVNASGELDAKAMEAVVVDNGPLCEMQVTSPPQERGERVEVVVAACSDTKPSRPVDQPREDAAPLRVVRRKPAGKAYSSAASTRRADHSVKKTKKSSNYVGEKAHFMAGPANGASKKTKSISSRNGSPGGRGYLTSLLRYSVTTVEDEWKRPRTKTLQALIALPETAQGHLLRFGDEDARYSVHARGPDGTVEPYHVGISSTSPHRPKKCRRRTRTTDRNARSRGRLFVVSPKGVMLGIH